MPAPGRRQSGMTLIELVVAIALLALVTTLAYRGLDSLSRSSEGVIGESERWQNVALFFARFGGDVTQPVARTVHVGAAQPDWESRRPAATRTPAPAASHTPGATDDTAAAGRAGLNPVLAAVNAVIAQNALNAQGGATPVNPGADASNAPTLPAWQGQSLAKLGADDISDQAALEFTRKSATGRDEIRVGYRLRGTRVELLIWPTLDRAPNTRPQVHPLLDDVAALRFRHLDASGAWQERWPTGDNSEAKATLPRAVEIELTLRDGTRLRRVFALPS